MASDDLKPRVTFGGVLVVLAFVACCSSWAIYVAFQCEDFSDDIVYSYSGVTFAAVAVSAAALREVGSVPDNQWRLQFVLAALVLGGSLLAFAVVAGFI